MAVLRTAASFDRMAKPKISEQQRQETGEKPVKERSPPKQKDEEKRERRERDGQTDDC